MMTESDVLIDAKETNNALVFTTSISFIIYKKPGLFKGFLNSIFLTELTRIGKASLIQMPGCSGIAILTGVFVEEPYRNKGVGGLIVKTGLNLAERFNYGKVIATVANQTAAMHIILKRLDFHPIDELNNIKTNNKVILYSHEN